MATALDDRYNQILALQTMLDDKKLEYNECLDTIWMLVASACIFFMHSGFSLLEAGSVRFKNAQNILAKNLIVVTVGFLCWYVMGYPLAFGVTENPSKFGGANNFFMDGFWADKKKLRIWLFQGTFCATGGTIVSGAMAERTQLKGFVCFTVLMTSIIYPLVVYWAWSQHGFLRYTPEGGGPEESIFGPPMMDFAGSGVVHMVGGVAAFFGAAIVGPRAGWNRGAPEGEFDGHHIPFTVLGTFFLLFGWYGFNPGSTGSLHDIGTAHSAALVAVNTTISACCSGLAVFFAHARIIGNRLDVGVFCNGILAGLVAITAGCANVKPWESAIIGIIGGVLYILGSKLLLRLKVDDVVDAFPVHGVNGFWGILAVGIFGNPKEGIGGNGLLYGGDQFRVQLLSALIIILWSAVLSFMTFFPLRVLGMLRLSDHFQEKGADVMEHAPSRAYTEDKLQA